MSARHLRRLLAAMYYSGAGMLADFLRQPFGSRNRRRKSIRAEITDLLTRSLQPLEPRLLMSTLYWAPQNDGTLGGSGTWNTSTNNLVWNTQSNGHGTQRGWEAGDTAEFTGTAGTVTVSGGVTAASLMFDVGGYTVASATGTGNTLSLSGGTVTVTNATDTATLSAWLGTASITKSGSGVLTFSGNSAFGYLAISAGEVQVATTLHFSGCISVDGDTTLSVADGGQLIEDQGVIFVGDSGILDVLPGGQLTLSGLGYDPNGGCWGALNNEMNGTVEIWGTLSVVDTAPLGYTVDIYNSGTILVDSGGILNLGSPEGNNRSTLYDSGILTNNGTMDVENGNVLVFGQGYSGQGYFTNGNEIDLNDQGSVTVSTRGHFENDGSSLKINDGGTLDLASSGRFINNDMVQVSAEGSLTVEGTIQNNAWMSFSGRDRRTMRTSLSVCTVYMICSCRLTISINCG